MDFGKNVMRQSILLGHFLCDRVQGVERFAAQPRHFPSQVLPPPPVYWYRFESVENIPFLVFVDCSHNVLLKICLLEFRFQNLLAKFAVLV